MKFQQYVPAAVWMVGCVIIACLVHLAAPYAGVFGHLLTAVAASAFSFVLFAREVNRRRCRSRRRQELPVQEVVHHHHWCGGDEYDDGYEGWMSGPDRPYPPPFSSN